MTQAEATFDVVLTRSVLEELLGDDDWVTVGEKGEPLGVAVPNTAGPATLLVTPVTDALKTLSAEGLIDSSVDRDTTWVVVGFALNRVVIRALADEAMTNEELLEAVGEQGLTWQWHVVTEPG